MLFAPKTLVWQPLFARGEVAIFLCRSFAERCKNHTESVRGQILKLAFRDITARFGTQSGHIDYESGIFPRGFYFDRDGLWLTLNNPPMDPNAHLVFTSHNADTTTDQMLLIQLFSAWAIWAAVAIGWE